MRIGELAELAGVSTRTVRHYHRIGLLPEPGRHSNGYRQYGMRDLLLLTRIRRLTELGLSLDEVRDALAGDDQLELREILAELDSDLAEQERRIHQRRQRLAELLDRPSGLPLTADDAVSGDLAGLLADIGTHFPDSTTARKDREFLALMGSVDTSDGDTATQVVTAFRRTMADPHQRARIGKLYERFDELADAATEDPRINELVRDIVDALPAELTAEIAEDDPDDSPLGTAMLAELAPAQAEVARRMLRQLEGLS